MNRESKKHRCPQSELALVRMLQTFAFPRPAGASYFDTRINNRETIYANAGSGNRNPTLRWFRSDWLEMQIFHPNSRSKPPLHQQASSKISLQSPDAYATSL